MITYVTSNRIGFLKQKTLFVESRIKILENLLGTCTNMAAVSLVWNTNMAAATPHENAVLLVVQRDTIALRLSTVTKTIATQSRFRKSVRIEQATILYRNKLLKVTAIVYPVKADLHVNNSLCDTWVISIQPSWYMCVTLVFFNTRVCHLATRTITESVPGLAFGNEVTVTFGGGRVNVKCPLPISLVKPVIMVTWIYAIKIK